MTNTFAGDKKKGQSLLGNVERRFINWGIPKVPKPIMSHHLTYVTIFWSAGTILFGWLATKDLVWLHGISVMVFGQWLTDSFDGTLGRPQRGVSNLARMGQAPVLPVGISGNLRAWPRDAAFGHRANVRVAFGPMIPPPPAHPPLGREGERAFAQRIMEAIEAARDRARRA